ncbi:dihydroxyacetone kinase subunit DhaL [Propionicicella superfundia]|uniref:dihydroxyacetone kinase subunit DhaL n=1 Tax=Propionicicella superfundia TaxID=348582 RepID=UPI00049021A0|nr:dihydroxyacetone kinase subunit DhaL [Propionicicella superfundia]
MAGKLSDVEWVVKDIAQTIVDNETYFGELDAVVGDGDFGFSLARGFEIVLADWDTFDRTDPGVFLQRIAMTVSARIGGTSGPIWGTAILRAGAQLKGKDEFTGEDVVRALRASVDGIKTRGGAELGEKTLLDALVPAIDTLEAELAAGHDARTIVNAVATTAADAAEATASLQAMRGRAAYTGERSIGSVDAGAMAIAVLARHLADAWPA